MQTAAFALMSASTRSLPAVLGYLSRPPRSRSTRALAEELAERLDLAVGKCRLELELQDGRLLHVWRHSRIGATSLER